MSKQYVRPPTDVEDDGDDTTCWTRKTRFQMALILVLFAVVPFFIAMVVIYLGNLFVWNQSEKCENMCKALLSHEARIMRRAKSSVDNWWSIHSGYRHTIIPVPPDIVTEANFTYPIPDDYDGGTGNETTASGGNGTTVSGGDFNQTDSQNNSSAISTTEMAVTGGGNNSTESANLNSTKTYKKREIFSCKQSLFPKIAVLLENLHKDSKRDKVVKCTVAVLSPVWVLTIKQCVNVNQPIKKFLIRINSDYWSKDGVVKKIEKIFVFKELVALRLEEKMMDDCLEKLIISLKINNDNVLTFFWKDSFKESLENRKKFDKIQVINVELKENLKISCEESCDDFSSPLVDQNGNYLIGFQANGQVVYYLNDTETLYWLNNLFNKLL